MFSAILCPIRISRLIELFDPEQHYFFELNGTSEPVFRYPLNELIFKVTLEAVTDLKRHHHADLAGLSQIPSMLAC